ncbi:MAG: hypothetical protein CMB32_01570 [Euryarchaeota archaeon]|nr:hypothetical protein [Euryarchaeota archaeon]
MIQKGVLLQKRIPSLTSFALELFPSRKTLKQASHFFEVKSPIAKAIRDSFLEVRSGFEPL